jgi:hypothetical protein
MKARSTLRGTLVVAATLLLSATAHAQLFRAYVASDGLDSNPCTLAAPCRLLPAALSAIADGGEIWMLDSANYNTATVTVGKSVSILAVPGAVGSVLAIGGPAISITASSLKVALRNLVIVPLAGGGGTNGVTMTGASTLFIENSLIANLPVDAVVVTGTGKLKVVNTIIRNNSGYSVSLSNGAYGEIASTQMLENGYGGVVAYGNTATTTTAIVSDSIVSGGTEGVYVSAQSASAVARAFVTRCTIAGTTWGLDSETAGVGSAVISVSSTMSVSNFYGYYLSGGGSVIKSLGNNHITDNTSNAGVLTATLLQ